MADFQPYDENNELLNAQYQSDNYMVVHHPRGKKGLCYVYFSGNGLYRADDAESFRDKILKDDRYEWQHLSASCKPEKEIFVRDIWLSWYAKGINQNLNSIDEVATWLKKECRGYRVTMIGNSAGGYMAINCAKRMPEIVDRVFSLCGQFSLLHHNNHTETNPLLIANRNLNDFECFQNTNDLKRVYYLVSYGVDHDRVQAEYASKIPNLVIIKFDSIRHGVTANNFDYPFLFSMSNQQLDQIGLECRNEMMKADEFSVMLYGKERLVLNKIKEKTRRRIRRIFRGKNDAI